MRRRLLNLLTALSLLLCVGVVALWGRSYVSSDYLRWRDSVTGVECASGRGQVLLLWTRETAPGSFLKPQPLLYWSARPARGVGDLRLYGSPGSWHGGGFDFGSVAPNGGLRGQHYVVPYWSVALASACLPALWLRHTGRRLRRRRLGQCVRCGYDLRATPARCPECGTIAPSQPAT